MKKPHVHAELIKAWADGAEIQSRTGIDKEWYDAFNPQWREHHEYRIKPEQTDLEKYGVEAGDIWKILPSDIVMTVRLVRKDYFMGINGVDYHLDALNLLLFRRGVVNKL
jgi:hypothetical protein